VRGWSTKIQHQGVRKTFALSAPTRAAAEAEARALIADIASEGWEVVVGRHQRENDRVYPKTDPRHWRQRLVLRRNSFPDAVAISLSVRPPRKPPPRRPWRSTAW
jgi:hypothetical protein